VTGAKKGSPPGRVRQMQLNPVAPGGFPALDSRLEPENQALAIAEELRNPVTEVLAHLIDASRAKQGHLL